MAQDTTFKDSIIIDESRDDLLTDFGKETLKDRYLIPGETIQGLFARVAGYYADDIEHARQLYKYMSKHWFMPATPILSNGGTARGLPISCFLNTSSSDSLSGIVGNWVENVWLASKGGGIGSYWGNIRSIGEAVGKQGTGKTCGIVPFINVQDALTLAISQGSLRRGSAAVYLPVWHPEIEEFIELRKPTGGDPNRKCLNLHHGVCIDDKFMNAVKNNEKYDLLSPVDSSVIESISARNIWQRILQTRIDTGEPYILNLDTVNRSIPEHHKHLGLHVQSSNLCVAGDTQINVMINGKKYKKEIAEINELFEQSEEILVESKNIETNKIEYKKLVNVGMTSKQTKVIKITYRGKTLKLTPDHNVYTENRGYIKAKDLKPHDQLVIK